MVYKQSDLDVNETLSHYINLDYLIEAIREGVIFAKLLDLYRETDPHEGCYAERDRARNWLRSQAYLIKLGVTPGVATAALEYLRAMGHEDGGIAFYIFCLRKDSEYRVECNWAYGGNGGKGNSPFSQADLEGKPTTPPQIDGSLAMITTNLSKLIDGLQEAVFFENVQYLPEGASRLGDGKCRTHCKDLKWAWEKEIRMLKPCIFVHNETGKLIDIFPELWKYFQTLKRLEDYAPAAYKFLNGRNFELSEIDEAKKIPMDFSKMIQSVTLPPGYDPVKASELKEALKQRGVVCPITLLREL